MENSGASISMAYSIRRESWVSLGHGLPLLKMSNIMQNHASSRAWSKKWMLDTDQFKYLEDDPKLLFFARADFWPAQYNPGLT